ncbi:lamin tail domain-containing protein [Candidatus Chloroploca sp. Khr17]|uniref:lamin tail domain-containing protein n=1 Tax=Candidatus Chloroploca sp. Khr17 TaxID=2496869 RepID=UPI00101D8354|nr:lamin tail domain-containing protein [Candidatus Chloroploca sp. Khr17]
MSSDPTKNRPQRTGDLLDTVSEVAVGVGRFGYSLLSLGLSILPKQSRESMHTAVRELSYGFARLPRDFADIAGEEIEHWANTDEAPPARVQKVAVDLFDAEPVAPAAPVGPTVKATPVAVATNPPPREVPSPEAKAAPTPEAAKSAAAAPAPKPAAVAPAPKPATAAPAPEAPKPVAAAPAPAAPKPAAAAPAPKPATAAPEAPKPVAAAPAPAASKPTPTAPATGGAKPASGPELEAPTGINIVHIEFDPPGRDVDGEYVLLRNTAKVPMLLAGWKLSDGGDKHTFTFPSFTLNPGGEVKIWTKSGKNNAGNLYWNSRIPIWNNTGDTASLRDAQGHVVARYTYEGKK